MGYVKPMDIDGYSWDLTISLITNFQWINPTVVLLGDNPNSWTSAPNHAS